MIEKYACNIDNKIIMIEFDHRVMQIGDILVRRRDTFGLECWVANDNETCFSSEEVILIHFVGLQQTQKK